MDKIKRIYHTRVTVLEMLKDRGYIDLEKKSTLKEFKKKFISDEEIDYEKLTLIAHKENVADNIIIFWTMDEQKVNIDTIKNYHNTLLKKNISRMILILSTIITPVAKTAIIHISQTNPIEVFQEDDLIRNKTKHKYVPKHRLLTETEKTDLLSKYNLKLIQLPIIKADDPIIRYYGWKRGSIVEITRKSQFGSYKTVKLIC